MWSPETNALAGLAPSPGRPDPGAPFGGVGASGIGRDLGPEAITAYQQFKSIYA
jgi:acyl-CoA reductase-like NAD-dependent aldehyde dehydrogenase